ncbi:MAG TPA: recombination protein RecR [Elusimicrobia bacterium]|nr:recombination protein RecR [Elusimicrobiota bacterium]
MKSLDKLASLFRRLPGVGPKQAERFSLYAVKASEGEIEDLVEALRAVKSSVKYCAECCNYSEENLCAVCANPSRDQTIICVVEHPQDVAAIEKTKTFNGVYHVLHGAISPTEGITPGAIKLKELTDRIKASDGAVKEMIIATNPDTEGEAMAIYLTRLLTKYVHRITRIAYGVPLGGDIDYLDEVTLGYALRGRTKI